MNKEYLNKNSENKLSNKANDYPVIPQRHIPFTRQDISLVQKVARQEKKFLITEMQLRQQLTQFKKVMEEDQNNGLDGYMVRSLYFDTLDNDDYTSKMEGVDNRKKIRLRIYNTNSDYAKLEMKQKQSAFQLKRSISIQREHVQEMQRGNYTSLLYYNDPFALECYSIMRSRLYLPKVIVQYQRTAFIGNGNEIRITFDNKIVATEANMDMFSSELCLYPVMDPFSCVLEVKYNNFLFSYIKDLVSRVNESPISASKYCMARTATQ